MWSRRQSARVVAKLGARSLAGDDDYVIQKDSTWGSSWQCAPKDIKIADTHAREITTRADTSKVEGGLNQINYDPIKVPLNQSRRFPIRHARRTIAGPLQHAASNRYPSKPEK